MTSSAEDLVVVGHRRPDLDSIAAALGYAWLLREGGKQATAARSGPLDEQSAWVLERFRLEPPELLADAAPSFRTITREEPGQPPSISLAEVIERIASGSRAVPIVEASGRPLALVDARACVHILGHAGARAGKPGSLDAIREGASRASEPVMASHDDWAAPLVLFGADERLSDRRSEIVRVDPDDFLVVDAAGRYVGLVSRSAILAPPRMRLVLVDHNEIGQSVAGAEQAEIVEVLDHHRLGNPGTLVPIPFSVDIVGSTATLVEERWRHRGWKMPAPLAGGLLSAVLSDTLAFRSPTTTSRDKEAASRLAACACIRDIEAFGLEVVAAGTGLGRRSGQEIVEEDFKEYDCSAGHLVVAQAEVRALIEVDSRIADLTEALERLRANRSASIALLLLTDPVRGVSRLMAIGEKRLLSKLPYHRASDGLWDVGAVVSRKTQLVPALLSALSPD
ncbi:MAG: DHH family phosphoesterase [Deltaproteobacteria bacterium]|nr:DHH family phosphoesterase [Deltaproteobacteria bacterium]